MLQIEKSLNNCFNYIFLDNLSPMEPKQKIIDFIKKNMSKKDSFFLPYNLLFQISSQCNLRCKHCFYHGDEGNYVSNEDLSSQEILSYIDFFADKVNILTCGLTGGEVFLIKDIFRIIEKLKQRNIFVEIRTNATLINESKAEALGRLLNPKFDNIQVSLDGATKDTHDKIRGIGNFEKSINAIKFLRKNNVKVSISYTIMSGNVQEVSQMYELCKNLGCYKLILNKISVCDETQQSLLPKISDVFNNVSSLIDKVKQDRSIKLDLNIKVYDFLQFDFGKKLLDNYIKTSGEPIPNNLMCHNSNSVFISARGNVSLCPNSNQNGFWLGNLREKPFAEIWSSRRNHSLFQPRTLENSICKKCAYVRLCHAGCPSEALKKYNDINYPDVNCFYGEKLIQQQKAKV